MKSVTQNAKDGVQSLIESFNQLHLENEDNKRKLANLSFHVERECLYDVRIYEAIEPEQRTTAQGRIVPPGERYYVSINLNPGEQPTLEFDESPLAVEIRNVPRAMYDGKLKALRDRMIAEGHYVASGTKGKPHNIYDRHARVLEAFRQEFNVDNYIEHWKDLNFNV